VAPSCSTISTALNQVNPCGHTSGVAYSLDGTLLATGNMDSPTASVHIWRLFDGALLHALDGVSSTTYDVAFSPDGQTLAAVGFAGTDGVKAKIYDVATGALIRTLPVHSGDYSDSQPRRSSSGAPPTARCSSAFRTPPRSTTFTSRLRGRN
jgi:WD40 repeat protein